MNDRDRLLAALEPFARAAEIEKRHDEENGFAWPSGQRSGPEPTGVDGTDAPWSEAAITDADNLITRRAMEHARQVFTELQRDCPECGGGGFVTVNDTWAKCGPDPQFDRDVRCNRCNGEGVL